MAVSQRQLLLDDSFIFSPLHGGEYAIGKRKEARPISTKKPIHLTLRSSYAVGVYSFRTKRNREFISALVRSLSRKWGIRIYEFSINSNHLHFALRTLTRKGFQNFLRTLGSQIATFVTGARKGKPFGKRFFDLPAFTRIAEWGKAFERLKAYVIQNVLEANGVISYQPRKAKGARVRFAVGQQSPQRE